MKAHINGIAVEGTPEEIFDLMCRCGDAGALRNKRVQSPTVVDDGSVIGIAKTTCSSLDQLAYSIESLHEYNKKWNKTPGEYSMK